MGFFSDLFRGSQKNRRPAIASWPNDLPATETGWGAPSRNADDVLSRGKARQPVTVQKIDVSSMRVFDLRALPSAHAPVGGTERFLGADEATRFGGSEYLLLATGGDEVSVFGGGRKVGELARGDAERIAPLLLAHSAEAFLVSGMPAVGNSTQLWVDLPKADLLAAHLGR
jgi:hypothetical protein